MKSFLEKYKELAIFVLLTVAIGLVGLFEKCCRLMEIAWSFFSKLDTATAIALATLGFLAYREYSKSMDEVRILLNVEGEELVDTKLKVLRKDISRSEILGILGMVQNDPTKRFNNSELQKKEKLLEFLKQIREAQKGERDTLEVPISREDFNKHFSNLKTQPPSLRVKA